jgi:hypothetical protein
VDAVQQATDPVANPTGNAFFFQERDLLSVSQAQRMASPAVNRVWRIKNPAAINPYRWAAHSGGCAGSAFALPVDYPSLQSDAAGGNMVPTVLALLPFAVICRHICQPQLPAPQQQLQSV